MNRIDELRRIEGELIYLKTNYVSDHPGEHMLSMAISFIDAVIILEKSNPNCLGIKENGTI
jgi:hypothetical protein